MSFEVRTGSRGPVAYWNGAQLTSAYDPDREAQAWLATKNFAPQSLIFVAGDPLGRVSQALLRAGYQAVALVPGVAGIALVPEGVISWAPEQGPLEDFLLGIFDRWGPELVVWEPWPAFERLAPQVVLEWSQQFRDLYRTVQGSLLNQRRFGPRQWKNSLRNIIDWQDPVAWRQGNRPLIIAASGPSLDDGLQVLRQHRAQFDLWALPSSFETLVQRGIEPDAGVATDGGYYAREHLRRLQGTPVPVLSALSGAADPVLASRPTLLFSQGLPFERLLLSTLVASHTEVPSQGTVAVTALRLALEATTGPVFIAGLDLSFRDLRGHTSPHSVDRRFEGQHTRLIPSEGLWAQRAFEQAVVSHEGVRTSSALLTYALWFRSRARFSRRVYRIAPSALRWDTMTEVSWSEAITLLQNHDGRRGVAWNRPPSWPQAHERRHKILTALDDLKLRIRDARGDESWLTALAQTGCPEVWSRDLRARRSGTNSAESRDALLDVVSRFQADL